jgi:regulator of replication initiation timing
MNNSNEVKEAEEKGFFAGMNYSTIEDKAKIDSLIEENKRLKEQNKELQNTLDYMKEKLHESAFRNINKAESK